MASFRIQHLLWAKDSTRDEQAMENLAHYIIRASFSQERMTYIQEESKVIYQSKDGKKEEAFNALVWLAAMCSHVPNKGEQMVRYYGYYRNVKRGRRKNKSQDEWMPCILEANESSKGYRKNWARLIQKIYEVDPLMCPKCSGKMKVISVIEDEDVIKKILKHLGLWEAKARLPAKTNANILYVAFARFGREIYKRRQKSMKAESKMILPFFEIPYIV